MKAELAKGLVSVKLMHDADGNEWLIVDIPNGWDDVKRLQNKMLRYKGGLYAFRCWDSDANLCYFCATDKYAEIV